MPVPKFVCEVICASVSASFMDGDVPWDTRSITQKAEPSSITPEKGNLGTHQRAMYHRVVVLRKHKIFGFGGKVLSNQQRPIPRF
jgi:hypothetical protein